MWAAVSDKDMRKSTNPEPTPINPIGAESKTPQHAEPFA
jgi:hypothetical protein